MASRTATSGGDYNLSNPLNSFVDVVRRMVFQTGPFFAGLPRQGSLIGPLVFGLLCNEISVFLVGLLNFSDVPRYATRLGVLLFDVRVNHVFLEFLQFFVVLVLAPIAAAVGVFLAALMTHLLVILVVGSGHAGFGATFRIVAYPWAVVSLAGWIPVVGWIFNLYALYLVTVGIQEMHSTTTGRALLVWLLPVILILGLSVVVVALIIVFLRAA